MHACMHACMHMPSICKNLGVCMHAGYQLEVSGFSGKFLVDVYLGNHRGTLQGKWNTHILSHRLRQTDRCSHRTHRLTQTHPHTHTLSPLTLSLMLPASFPLSLALSHACACDRQAFQRKPTAFCRHRCPKATVGLCVCSSSILSKASKARRTAHRCSKPPVARNFI